MKRKVAYQVGDAVSIPLVGGGFGIAIITRIRADTTKYSVIDLLGISRIFPDEPTIENIDNVVINDVIHSHLTIDKSILTGRWKVLGPFRGYDATCWKRPPNLVGTLANWTVLPPTFSKYRLIVDDPVTQEERNIPAPAVIEERDAGAFPLSSGLFVYDALEETLAKSIREQSPEYVCKATPENLAIWRKTEVRAAQYCATHEE